LDDVHINRARAAAAKTLAGLRSKKAVSALARACFDGEGGKLTAGCFAVRRAAVAALPCALRELGPDDYGHVEPEAIGYLCRLLSRPDEPLVLDLLAALDRVGGGSAVEAVERTQRETRSQAVREAAARVLPILLERQRREYDPQRLLRPTEAPAEAVDSLLRPALGVNLSDPELLLRPSATEESA